MAGSCSRASMAWRCFTKASEARYNCIAPMASFSTPSSSPRPLSRPSQRWVSRSLAGCAMRPTIKPAAAARSAPLTPSSSSSGISPTCSRAHSPACSTPTLRGRASAMESGWTATLSAGASAATPTPRASSKAAMRCASVSTVSGSSAISACWPSSRSSIRAHSPSQAADSISKWRPRFNSVRCRTLSPRRSLRTSRQVL